MAARRRKGRGRSKVLSGFVSEAEENLERMRSDLADLYDQREAGGEVDPDLVNRLFRLAHSLKGLASMFSLDPIANLAHRAEDLLDALRLGRLSLSSPAVDLLDEAMGLFSALIGEVDEPNEETHQRVPERGHEVMSRGAGAMRDVAQQVRGTTAEQVRGSGRIRRGVEGVRAAVERINESLQEQTKAFRAAVEFLDTVHGRTGTNEEAAQRVGSATRELLQQAESLRDEVRRFRV